MALYLGTIALEVHWSLERTQQMVDLLVDEHVLRQLTEDEKRQMMFPSGANMYVLIERASPSKARM